MSATLSRMALLMGTGGMLCACSWFSSVPATIKTSRQVTLTFIADAMINPAPLGGAQPVRVCLYQTSQPGWTPDGALMGTPCSNAAQNRTAGAGYSAILVPAARQEFKLDMPADQPGWLVVAAEFQQTNGTQSLLEVPWPAQQNLAVDIQVYRNRITAVTHTKE